MSKEDKKEKQSIAGLPDEAIGRSVNLIYTKASDYRNVYANNAIVKVSTWDVSLNFGQVIGEESGVPKIESSVSVTMSREMAKVLSGILSTHIMEYEKQFGEIKIPIFKSKDEQSNELLD
jgi:hypothetical protein